MNNILFQLLPPSPFFSSSILGNRTESLENPSTPGETFKYKPHKSSGPATMGQPGLTGSLWFLTSE